MSSTLKKTDLINDNNSNQNIIAAVGYEINKLVDELIRLSRTQRSKIRELEATIEILQQELQTCKDENKTMKQQLSKYSFIKRTSVTEKRSSFSNPSLHQKPDLTEVTELFLDLRKKLLECQTLDNLKAITLELRNCGGMLQTFKQKIDIDNQEVENHLAKHPRTNVIQITLPVKRTNFESSETFERFCKLFSVAISVLEQSLNDMHFLTYKLENSPDSSFQDQIIQLKKEMFSQEI